MVFNPFRDEKRNRQTKSGVQESGAIMVKSGMGDGNGF